MYIANSIYVDELIYKLIIFFVQKIEASILNFGFIMYSLHGWNTITDVLPFS